jgi:hypothetical protein
MEQLNTVNYTTTKSNTLLDFFLKLDKKSDEDSTNIIKEYISSLYELKNTNREKAIEDMKNLIYLLIILGSMNSKQNKIYYFILKELIIEHQTIIEIILFRYPPIFGYLSNISQIQNECLIENSVIDRFKLVLNIISVIDFETNKGIKYKYNHFIYELFENKKCNIKNNNIFIDKIKKLLTMDRIIYINTVLILNQEGFFFN